MNRTPPKSKTPALVIVLIVAAVLGAVVVIGGVLFSLAIVGVTRYLAAAKTAEARNAVGIIARNIARESEQEHASEGGTTKVITLRSFPPVPADVQHGRKYLSAPSDWAPWKAIKFEMNVPQYYQYEVRAAADGQSAEVIARGDLDGNGKTSLFSLKVLVENGVVVVAPTIDETDPDE